MPKYVIRVTEMDENGVEQPVKDLEGSQRLEADGLCLIAFHEGGSTNVICHASLLDIATAITENKTLYSAAKLSELIKTMKEDDSDAAT